MIKPKNTVENAKYYDVPLFEEQWDLKLDANENVIGPSQKVLDAIKNIDYKNISYYPLYGELLQKISRCSDVSDDCIIATNGCDEALNVIINTYLEKDDKILSVWPSFVMPQIYSNLVGAQFVEVPYKQKWVFPIEDFLSKIDENINAVLVTTPNSPTGELISDEDLKQILEKSKDKVVIIDETYANYANKTYSQLVLEYDNVFVVKSFSKDFALAGLRLGYVLSNSQNILNLKKVISPFSVNTIAVIAGIAALEDKDHFEYVKEQVEASKKILIEGLKPYVKDIYPSSTNFLCIDAGEKAEFLFKKLLSASIKIKWFKDAPYLQNHFRMSVPSVEGAQKILKALEPRKMIVFDMDGVLIDTRNSYRMAIKQTHDFFASKEVSFEEIQAAKNIGGLNNDWDTTEYLLKKSGVDVNKSDIIDKFQELYWADGNGLIKDEKMIISVETLKFLSKSFDLAIFTGRPKAEAVFALEKNMISDLFSVVITMDDLPEDMQKPHPQGLEIINRIAAPIQIYYLGDTTDDMICAKNATFAQVFAVGVLPPQDKSQELKKSLKNAGAMVVLENTEEISQLIGDSQYANS